MKKFFKVLVLSIIIILSAFCVFGCNPQDTDGSNGIKYLFVDDDNGGYYTLTKYKGEDTTFNVLSEYNSKPVKKIKKGAFEGNSTIKTLVIPNSVETIEAGAFSKMTALENLTIPFVGTTADSVAELNKSNVGHDSVNSNRLLGIFFSTTSFNDGIEVSQNYNTSNNASFYFPLSLKKVTINAKNDYAIPAFAFNNTFVEEVVLNDKVVEIGEYAFSSCEFLKTIKIPYSVTSIDAYAFSGCSSLNNGFSFDNTLEQVLIEIKSHAFFGTKIQKFDLPDSLTTIGDFAFASVMESDYKTVSSLSKVNDINLGDLTNLNNIGDYAFYYCSELVKPTLSGITLGKDVFVGCKD